MRTKIITTIVFFLTCHLSSAQNDSIQDDSVQNSSRLSDLSIDELMNIEVVSASKNKEKLDIAPSTIYVFTEEEILKNGYYSIKDILQNAPGFETIDLGFFLIGGS